MSHYVTRRTQLTKDTQLRCPQWLDTTGGGIGGLNQGTPASMESHNCAGDHSHRHLPSPHTDNAPPPPPEASNMDVETPDHVHSESRMDCPVCLSNAPQQAPSLASVLLKCGHRNWLIHNECIVPWLSRSRTPTCPLCRCVTRASSRPIHQ